MRPIKFRAWSKRNGFYINDVQDAYDGTGPERPFDCFGDALNDEYYDVEQFTGLHDKNGAEIWEGDILVDARYGSMAVVSWSDWQAGFVTRYSEDTMTTFDLFLNRQFYKVIGNIHENPELLEAR